MGVLTGRTAMITGASSGIGLAVAKLFAAEGAQVVISGRSRSALDAAVGEIGAGALGIDGDVADPAHHARVAQEIAARFGELDIYMANAGINTIRHSAEVSEAEYDAQFARLLALRFPLAHIVKMDATELAAEFPAQTDKFGAVICGLGLMNMRPDRLEALLRGAFALMAPDAGFYLFTYGRKCSVPDKILHRLGLRAERVGTVLRNLPPAAVYRIVRRPADDI